MTLSVVCRCCGQRFEIQVEEQDYYRWRDGGVLIQHAFPYLSVGERELLISDTCSECFDRIFENVSE